MKCSFYSYFWRKYISKCTAEKEVSLPAQFLLYHPQLKSLTKRVLVGPLTQCWNPAVHCLPHLSKRSPPFLHSLKMASKRYVCIKKKECFFSFCALCIHILDSARIQLKTPTDFILIYKSFHLQQVHQARSSCLNPTD